MDGIKAQSTQSQHPDQLALLAKLCVLTYKPSQFDRLSHRTKLIDNVMPFVDSQGCQTPKVLWQRLSAFLSCMYFEFPDVICVHVHTCICVCMCTCVCMCMCVCMHMCM